MHGMRLRYSNAWLTYPASDGVIVSYINNPESQDNRIVSKRQGIKNRFLQSNFDKMEVTIRVKPKVTADVPVINGDESFHFIESQDEHNYACALDSHPPIVPTNIQEIIDTNGLDTLLQSWEYRGGRVLRVYYFWVAYNSKEVMPQHISGHQPRVIFGQKSWYNPKGNTPREKLQGIRNNNIPMNLATCTNNLAYTTRYNMYGYDIQPATIPSSFYDDNYLRNLMYLAIKNTITTRQANELWGSALSSAVDGARTTEVVNLENLFQFIDFVKDIPNWPQTLSNIANTDITKVKESAKFLANSKLMYDYAFKTTVSDAVRLVHDLKKFQPPESNLSRGRAMGQFESDFGSFHVKIERNEGYRIYYGSVDESTLKFYRMIQDIGLDPSFEHVWDSIPYSFVVDWLLPIGKLLKEVDYDTYVSTLPVYAYTHTRWDKLELDNGSVSLEISNYTRNIGKELPNYPYFLPSDKPHVNWWNAGALIIQRIR